MHLLLVRKFITKMLNKSKNLLNRFNMAIFAYQSDRAYGTNGTNEANGSDGPRIFLLSFRTILR